MAKSMHTGDACFACQKIFTDSDDVVVCPVCGTPYHRACWNDHGACINTPLHESGKTYVPLRSLKDATVTCPNCGTKNPRAAAQCQNCGAALPRKLQNPPKDVPYPEGHSYPGQDRESSKKQHPVREFFFPSPEEEDAEESPVQDMAQEMEMEELGRFVGRNQRYYIPKFTRFRAGRHISINIPCLFFPQMWLGYRKMLVPAIVLTVVRVLLDLPQHVVDLVNLARQYDSALSQSSSQDVAIMERVKESLGGYVHLLSAADLFGQWLSLALAIVFGLLGNWFYYRYADKHVKEAQQKIPDLATRQLYLIQEGGTSVWLCVIMGLATYVLPMIFTWVLIFLFS